MSKQQNPTGPKPNQNPPSKPVQSPPTRPVQSPPGRGGAVEKGAPRPPKR